MLQREQIPVAGHEKVGISSLSQREHMAVFGVGCDRASPKITTKKRKVPKARGVVW